MTATDRADQNWGLAGLDTPEVSFDGVNAFLHVSGEFVHPEAADPPAACDQLPIAQAVSELAVAIHIGMPATAIYFDIQPLPLGLDCEIERAAAHGILREWFNPHGA